MTRVASRHYTNGLDSMKPRATLWATLVTWFSADIAWATYYRRGNRWMILMSVSIASTHIYGDVLELKSMSQEGRTPWESLTFNWIGEAAYSDNWIRCTDYRTGECRITLKRAILNNKIDLTPGWKLLAWWLVEILLLHGLDEIAAREWPSIVFNLKAVSSSNRVFHAIVVF